MGVGPSSGSKIYIGTTATNPVGDTYVEVSNVTNLGEFGRVFQKIPFDALGARGTQKFKGQYDDGTMQLDLGRSPADAGNAAMIVARDTDFDYNFKVTLNDASSTTGATPTTFYFKAKVMSYTTNIAGPTNVVMAKTTLEIKSGSITEQVAT